jgi:hypothetical protein
MKNLIIILLLVVTTGINAQTTVKIKSKSALGDSILINRGALEVTPLPTGSGSDTIRSIDYKLSPTRDTLQTMIVQITSYNKNAMVIQTDYLPVQQSLFTKWKVLINALDAYIQAQRKRLIKL